MSLGPAFVFLLCLLVPGLIVSFLFRLSRGPDDFRLFLRDLELEKGTISIRSVMAAIYVSLCIWAFLALLVGLL